MALSLLTAGCSGESGAKASSAAPPAGSPTTAQPTSAGDPTATTTTTTTTSAGSSIAQATNATTGGTVAPVAVCTTLPTAQVASLSGKALTSSREQDSAGINAYECSYYTASHFGGLSVTVQAAQGTIAYANILSNDKIEGAAENVIPLAGIGDKAFSATDGVHVLFGDRMISVAGVTSVPLAEAIVALQAKLT